MSKRTIFAAILLAASGVAAAQSPADVCAAQIEEIKEAARRLPFNQAVWFDSVAGNIGIAEGLANLGGVRAHPCATRDKILRAYREAAAMAREEREQRGYTCRPIGGGVVNCRPN